MALQFELKVVPSSGRTALIIDKFCQLKCYLKSPPEKGKANRELIRLLAKKLHITQADVTIIAGATGRKKTVRLESDITFTQLKEQLCLDSQKNLFE